MSEIRSFLGGHLIREAYICDCCGFKGLFKPSDYKCVRCGHGMEVIDEWTKHEIEKIETVETAEKHN